MSFLFPTFFFFSVGLQIMILWFEYGNHTVKKPKADTGGRKRHGHTRPVQVFPLPRQKAYA